MDEQNLIIRLKNGDLSALEALMELHQNYVFTVALRMVKKKEPAEEITQDVFIKVYKKINSYKERSKFTTWLFTIVYRTCLNYLDKKQIVYSESSLESCLNESKVDRSLSSLQQKKGYYPRDEYFGQIENISSLEFDLQEILWKAIDQLSYQQGVIITLYYIQQFTVSEISEIMQTPSNTIKTQLHRGRNNLKEVLLKKYTLEELI
jgi:RNA polymerase sigma-70 factor (ECF subfamily)